VNSPIATPRDKVIIYSDGGADPNPGIGGWAAILLSGANEKVLTGHDPHTTNNRMELQAAIQALAALTRPCQVEFHTDSQYVRKGITQYLPDWKRRDWNTKAGRPVQNADLWRELDAQTRQHEIAWHWVEGHSGNLYNERVDRLARDARLSITPRTETDANTPKLYVRSSCKGNPGPGGWAAVYETPQGQESSADHVASTTNNRMELTAIIEGLLMVPVNSTVEVHTTSDYVYQGITQWINGWRRRNWQKKDGQPVANADLWRALDKLTANYQIRWVNAKNETHEALSAAGRLATEAAGQGQSGSRNSK
jgi:ribonuclease HI